MVDSCCKSGKALLQQMASSAAMSSVDPGSRKDSSSRSERRDLNANIRLDFSLLVSDLTCKNGDDCEISQNINEHQEKTQWNRQGKTS